jgi:hypothetical protein
MNDIKTFVLLKYEILTSDADTWHLCDTYPAEVRSRWAWRCAADVEHLAKGYPKAEECIRVAKLYRDGLANKEELDKAWCAANASANAYAYAAATYQAAHYAYYAAYAAAHAANAYVHASAYAKEEKWKLYISWLIEELCEWESKQ